MSSDGLTASSLIKRFRESKPMPKEERKKIMPAKHMWWEEQKNDTFEDPYPRSIEPRKIEMGNYSHDNAFKNRSLGKSDDLNSRIEEELRNLEREINRKEKETYSRLNLSYSRNSFDNSVDINSSSFQPNEYPTLGSTGLLGLSKPDLKLDGIIEEEEKPQKKEEPPTNLEVDLEALLKSLQDNPFMKPQPEEVKEEPMLFISEIGAGMEAYISEFSANFNQKYKDLEEDEKQRKIRDDQMKEEGRREEREKILLLDLMNIDIPVSSRGNFPPKHRESTEERKWNPFPEVTHSSILNTTKAIESCLNSTIDTLNNRLPAPPVTSLTSSVGSLLALRKSTLGSDALAGHAANAVSNVTSTTTPAVTPRPPVLNNPSTTPSSATSTELKKSTDNLTSLAAPKPSEAVSVLKVSTSNNTTPVPTPNNSQTHPTVASMTGVTTPAPTPAAKITTPTPVTHSVSFQLPNSSSIPATTPATSLSTAASLKKLELDRIDALLGFEDYRSKSTNRFNPFIPINSMTQGSTLSLDAAISAQSKLNKNININLDPLKDVRQERIFHFPSTDMYQENLVHAGISIVPQTSSHHSHHSHSNYASIPSVAPSAPPMNMEFQILSSRASPIPINGSNSNQFNYPKSSSSITSPVPFSSLPDNLDQAVQLAQNMPLRRPLEGTAMAYLRQQNNQPLTTYDQELPSISFESSHDYPMHSIAEHRHKMQSSFSTQTMNTFQMPSASSSINEKAQFLQDMKNLRMNLANL